MAASISDTMGKMIFQTEMGANLRKINKTDYAVFEGEYNNGAVAAAFDIRMKLSYIRKCPVDLIKNDHMVLQKRGSYFFFLFEGDKSKFKEEGDFQVFEESGKTGHYNYRVSFRKDTKAQAQKPKSRLGGKAGQLMDEVNELLEKNGITEADPSSPVSEYMKSWRLGHPDGE